MTIAGHSFNDTPQGRVCSCGRRWVDIMGVTRADIGKPHIAHVGNLNEREALECEAECERFWSVAMGREVVG